MRAPTGNAGMHQPAGLDTGRADMGTQFVCGLMVLGQGMISLVAFSSYLPVFRRYSHTLVLAVAVGLIVNTLTVPVADDDPWRSGAGLLALVCAERGDAEAQADRLLAKLL